MSNFTDKVVLGAGQCGTRLAADFALGDDELITLNTDSRDTGGANLSNNHTIVEGGAGQQYSKGIKIWSKNRDKVSKILSNVEDERVVYFISGGGGCFIPENKVLMENGSYKEIKDIIIGDKVVTKDDTIEMVEKVWTFDKTDEELFEFELENGKSFTCTGDHKILVYRNNKKVYIEAEHINENDELVSIK